MQSYPAPRLIVIAGYATSRQVDSSEDDPASLYEMSGFVRFFRNRKSRRRAGTEYPAERSLRLR